MSRQVLPTLRHNLEEHLIETRSTLSTLCNDIEWRDLPWTPRLRSFVYSIAWDAIQAIDLMESTDTPDDHPPSEKVQVIRKLQEMLQCDDPDRKPGDTPF